MCVFLSNPLQLTEELFALWILWCLPAIYTNSCRTEFVFPNSSVPLFVIPEDDPGLDEEVNEFENPAMKLISELSLQSVFA